MKLINTKHTALQTTHLVNPSDVNAAPLFDLPKDSLNSVLHRSLQHQSLDLKRIAQDADMAIGLTDLNGTLLWT